MARFRFSYRTPDDYNLALYQDDYRQPHHILIVLQTVDSRDLESGTLLSKEVMPTFKNALRAAKQHARRIDASYEQFTITVVNFNNHRHLHLSQEQRSIEEATFAKRVQAIIKEVKPDKVLISGDQAFHAIHPNVKNHLLKRGWVQNLSYNNKQQIPTTLTLDFMRLLEREGLNANLLGMWIHHFANLIVGYHPYSIADVEPKPRYVDTDAKFATLMRKLCKTKRVAIDTETKNLTVNFNQIYMIQFALEEEPDCAYVVPLRHPMTPLTTEQQAKWSRQLHRFFSGDRTLFNKPYQGKPIHSKHRLNQICTPNELPELVFFNANFDLRIILSCLKVRIIPHFVYEIRAGEHLLDENGTELRAFNTRSGNLLYVTHYYGNDYYSRAEFGKEDRETCGSIAPNDIGLLKYCAMDVQAPLAIRKQQIKRASHHLIHKEEYTPYFLRHMRYIMGPTEHQLARLRQCGSTVDLSYLKLLVSQESPLLQEIQERLAEFKDYPTVIEANKDLVQSTGHNAYSLWGSASESWIFTLSKPTHRQHLFLGKLGLEPVGFTAKGVPAIDKAFIDQYRSSVSEVDSYGNIQELDKLYGTYAKGWLKRLRTTMDGTHDYSLRPDYAYFNVATGRLASYDPSLQVIPTRGKAATLVKRAFIAPRNRIMVRLDLNAHEVRMWSIVSNDMKLADAFRVGQQLRQQYILNPTKENAEQIKLHGDLHIANVKRFFNRVVDKKHPLRDSVKAVVFGAIYMKSAHSLGEDTKLPDINAQKAIVSTLKKERKDCTDQDRLAQIDIEIQAAYDKMESIRAEDRTDFAQDLLDRLFREFTYGAKWIERMKKSAVDNNHTYSPIGRRRNLYATLISDQKVQARQIRRGVNAPIQGIASEQGTEANRATDVTYYLEEPVICHMTGVDPDSLQPLAVNRIVHDASYFTVDYEMAIPLIHMVQHETTYGSTERFDKHFGLKFTVEPEVEVEITVRDDKSYTWDWSLPNLIDCFANAINDADELGLNDFSKKEAMHKILKPWLSKESREYLHNKYPLLGVPEVQNNVKDAVQYARSKF